MHAALYGSLAVVCDGAPALLRDKRNTGCFFFVVPYAVKYDIQVKNGVVVNNQKVQPPTVPSLDTRFVAAASITHSHRHGKLRMQLY